jgi:hypothetical protein
MKVIFAHNVFDRPKTLLATIKKEKELFPDAKVCVAYNNAEISKSFHEFQGLNVDFIYFNQKYHKIGCTNGAFHSIYMAIKNSPDIIVFSHDDVYLSNPNVFVKNISEIKQGCDFIGRVPGNLPDIGKEYVMMETMYFSLDGAKKIYENFKPFSFEDEIERDLRGSISPEVNMYNLVKNLERKKLIEYEHGNDPDHYNKVLDEILGYTHLNIGKRAWKE